MNSENAFKQLGQKLMNGEITPEEHVKEYNRLLKEMSEKYDSQWRPRNRWRWRIDFSAGIYVCRCAGT